MHPRRVSEHKDEDVEISFEYPLHDINENYKLELTITNETNSTCFKNVRVYLDGNGFEKTSRSKVIPIFYPGDSKKVILEVEKEARCTIKDISPTITLILFGNGKIIKKFSLEREVPQISIKTLGKYGVGKKDNHDGRLNIFFFGKMGAGKTSMINAFYTLFSKERTVIEKGSVGGGSGHVTKELHQYVTEFKFDFWDAWGLTKENYRNFGLGDIINGNMAKGWKMGKTHLEQLEYIKNKKGIIGSISDAELNNFKKGLENSGKKRKMHSVIFVIPLSDISDDEIMGHTAKYYEKIADIVSNPTVVISRADENYEEIYEDPLHPCEDLMEYKYKVARVLNIPPKKIFFGTNYVKTSKQSFNIDLNNFMILRDAVKQASINTGRIEQEDNIPLPSRSVYLKSSTNVHFYFVIDHSGSMASSSLVPKDEQILKTHPNMLGVVFEGIINYINDRTDLGKGKSRDRVTVVKFDDEASVVFEDFKGSKDEAREKLINVKPRGYTYFHTGLKLTFELMEKYYDRDVKQKRKSVILLLTDGYDFKESKKKLLDGGDLEKWIAKFSQIPEFRVILHTMACFPEGNYNKKEKQYLNSLSKIGGNGETTIAKTKEDIDDVISIMANQPDKTKNVV